MVLNPSLAHCSPPRPLSSHIHPRCFASGMNVRVLKIDYKLKINDPGVGTEEEGFYFYFPVLYLSHEFGENPEESNFVR